MRCQSFKLLEKNEEISTNSTKVRVFKKHFILKIAYLPMHMLAHVPSETRRGHETPRTGVPGGGEPPEGCQELDSVPT